MRTLFNALLIIALFSGCSKDKEFTKTVISKIHYEHGDGYYGDEYFTYNNGGRLVKEEDRYGASNTIIMFGYEGDRLTTRNVFLKSTDGSLTLTIAQTFDYDTEGTLRQVISVGESYERVFKVYWSNDRIEKTEFYDNEVLQGSNQYTYDPNGNIILIEAYDENGSLTYLIEYEYDTNPNSLTLLADPIHAVIGNVLYVCPNNMISSKQRLTVGGDVIAGETATFTYYMSGFIKERINASISPLETLESRLTVYYKRI